MRGRGRVRLRAAHLAQRAAARRAEVERAARARSAADARLEALRKQARLVLQAVPAA